MEAEEEEVEEAVVHPLTVTVGHRLTTMVPRPIAMVPHRVAAVTVVGGVAASEEDL